MTQISVSVCVRDWTEQSADERHSYTTDRRKCQSNQKNNTKSHSHTHIQSHTPRSKRLNVIWSFLAETDMSASKQADDKCPVLYYSMSEPSLEKEKFNTAHR